MGKIYKLFNGKKTYIGSTHLPLDKRLDNHLNHYKSFLQGKHNYVSSFDIFEMDDDYFIELLEEVEDEDELKIREDYYITTIECVNRRREFRSIERNKMERREHYEKWKQSNPEKIKSYYIKRNILITCECGCEVSKRNIARHIKTEKHINLIENK